MSEQELQEVQEVQEVPQAQEVQAEAETQVAETAPVVDVKTAKQAARQKAKEDKAAQRAAAEAAAKESRAKKKKSSPLYEKLFRLFSNKIAQIIFVIAVMLLSAFSMFLLDDYNHIRKDYLPWLENNFFGNLLQSMNVKRDLYEGGWLIFLTLFGIILLFIIASSFRKKIVDNAVKKHAASFKTEASAKSFYNFLFYLVVVLLIAAAIFVLYMMGIYSPLWTPREGGELPPDVTAIVLNLLYIILLCAIFILLIPIALFILSLILHVIFSIFGWFAAMINQFRRNMDEDIALGGGGAGGFGETNVDIDDPVSIEIDEPIHIQEEPAPKSPLGKEIFPSLVRIDDAYAERETVQNITDLTLEEFVLQFQSFAIQRKIYYELPMLRSFLAGMSATRLIILEGLSGTGKSMLPRMFCEFTGSKSFFAPVQATWRDKSDLLGYFSEFTKSFKSTDFLKNLYESAYTDRVNLMVLDEMNISRIEYYFADFLSILEYPAEDWKVRVFEPELGQELPNQLYDGYVSIPENTWFIGTANTDDSTFTITDKVYDRATVLDFAEKFSPITSTYNSDPVHIDAATLKAMFKQAQSDSSKCLSKTDEEKFAKVCDYIAEGFDLRFGNRIMVQINNFVPVYVALGGSKEEALDFMFARKVLRKLNGAFEDYVKDKLIGLLKLLHTTYGKGTFKETEKTIEKILKRLV